MLLFDVVVVLVVYWYENLLELSVKQLVIQSSSIFLGQTMYGWQNQMLMLFAAKLGIFLSNKIYPGPRLIQFRLKGSNKSKFLS